MPSQRNNSLFGHPNYLNFVWYDVNVCLFGNKELVKKFFKKINEIFKEMIFLGGYLSVEYGCSAIKGDIHHPRVKETFHENFVESLHSYYLLAFTENLKYSPKKRHFIF